MKTNISVFILTGVLTQVGWTEFASGPSSSRNLRGGGLGSPKGLYTGPYFSPSLKSNYSVMTGDNVHLSCQVFQVDRESVSWVRSADSAILSVDNTLFVYGSRILVVENRGGESGSWTLIVKEVRKSDEGRYECQISTQHKMSHFAYLKVVEPVVEIEGGPDVFTKQGSTVRLKCQVTGSAHVNAVIWYHGSQVIGLNSSSIEIKLERAVDITLSQLTIHNVQTNRIGNYSCVPGGLQPTTVHLHVLDAKEQGLMSNTSHRFNHKWMFLLILLKSLC